MDSNDLNPQLESNLAPPNVYAGLLTVMQLKVNLFNSGELFFR